MASAPDLSGKMDSLLKAFANVGQQLKEMQEAIRDVSKGMKELKDQQKNQDGRVSKLEQGQNKHELRLNSLEDRQRRANIRLRGFRPDFAESGNMIQMIHQWLVENKILVDQQEFERAHWIFGPRRSGRQRDIIVRFASEKRAFEIYRELKQVMNLNHKGTPIRVLKDLSAQTLQARNQMRPVADALFQGGVRFTWQYPAIIVVFKNTKIYRAKTLEEGKEMLLQLGLDLDTRQTASPAEPFEATGGGEGLKSVEESIRNLYLPEPPPLLRKAKKWRSWKRDWQFFGRKKELKKKREPKWPESRDRRKNETGTFKVVLYFFLITLFELSFSPFNFSFFVKQ